MTETGRQTEDRHKDRANDGDKQTDRRQTQRHSQ